MGMQQSGLGIELKLMEIYLSLLNIQPCLNVINGKESLTRGHTKGPVPGVDRVRKV
jgi:hypothetical protein